MRLRLAPLGEPTAVSNYAALAAVEVLAAVELFNRRLSGRKYVHPRQPDENEGKKINARVGTTISVANLVAVETPLLFTTAIYMNEGSEMC